MNICCECTMNVSEIHVYKTRVHKSRPLLARIGNATGTIVQEDYFCLQDLCSVN